VRVNVGVQVGNGVGVSGKGEVEADGVNTCQVGEEVGTKLGVVVGAEVAVEVRVAVVVAMLVPSARESEKPPSSKPIEARAMNIPRSTCHKFFIVGSLRSTLQRPASGH
jgi:hypothetical protein